MSLYKHIPHPHKPRNVNEVHASEHTSLNARIAVTLTKSVGTMICAYLFVGLALAGLPLFQGPQVQWVQWTSQTLIQLTMLSVIMVGQSIEGRRQALQADEAFNTTMRSFHDTEQIAIHMDKQDEILRAILERMEAQKKP